MKKYRCLICGEVFDVADGVEPVCPKCGLKGNKLELIAEEGRIVKLFFPDEVTHYDAITDGHYHFVCKRCLKIIDLHTNVRPALPTDYDFEVESQEINFYGRCRECQQILQS